MQEDTNLYSPAQAAQLLSELSGKTITVGRLGQLRRSGKIQGQKLGYNTILYTLSDLQNADLQAAKTGRKTKKRRKRDTMNTPNVEDQLTVSEIVEDYKSHVDDEVIDLDDTLNQIIEADDGGQPLPKDITFALQSIQNVRGWLYLLEEELQKLQK